MQKCIYTKKMFKIPEGGKYPQEHIIPAGLGGIEMLPENYVSIEANNSFSVFEMDAMRKGILSLPRSFFGPGKRGKQSQNIKKQSKSIIHLMQDLETDKFELGFVAKGLPYPIFQMFIDNFDEFEIEKNELHIFGVQGTHVKNTEESFEKMTKALQAPEHFNYVQITNESFPKGKVLVGYFAERIYLAIAPNLDKKKVFNWLTSLKFENAHRGSEVFKYQPKCSMSLETDLISIARLCAKTAFNLLAARKGKEFVLNTKFDEIRNFILRGEGEYTNFWSLSDKLDDELIEKILIKYNKHFIMISSIDSELRALVSFYGMIFHVKLANDCDFKFSENMICFWEDKSEMTFDQLLYNKGDYYIYILDPLGKFKGLVPPRN